jgi:CubicO group peptidase (beta-lactamase class C family)
MPAVYCCYRATPHDWLRYGAALATDGNVRGRQLWPEGWVKEMTTPSAIYPNYGYQIWVGNPSEPNNRLYNQGIAKGAPHGPPIEAENVFFLEGGGYRTMYVMPDLELVILRLGYMHPDWQTSTIPNFVLGGLDR